jgi:hypothetical protein
MSTYESFPSGPPKSKTGNKGLIAGVLVGVLVLITVVVVAIVIRNETKKQQQPNGGSSSLAVTSTATATHSKGAGLPVDGYYPEFQGQEWAQDGYYGTVGDGNDAAFWGVQKGPTRMPPGTMKPNEPLLGEIRRERFNYRERISNRMNMNSYSFPNNNGFWPRAAYAGQIRLSPGQWPKLSTTFARPWRSESGPCGSSRPCPFAGPDNAGTVVQAFGKLSRRGMCLPSGRCDCPSKFFSNLFPY